MMVKMANPAATRTNRKTGMYDRSTGIEAVIAPGSGGVKERQLPLYQRFSASALS